MTQYRTHSYKSHAHIPLCGDCIAATIVLLRMRGMTTGQARGPWEKINTLAHARGGRTLAYYTRAVDAGNAMAGDLPDENR